MVSLGAVVPFVYTAGAWVPWRRLVVRDLSTSPPTQMVSWSCVVSDARSLSTTSTTQCCGLDSAVYLLLSCPAPPGGRLLGHV